VRRGERSSDAAHVDDTLLRVRQLRDAMVGSAQLAPGAAVADGLTFPVACPLAANLSFASITIRNQKATHGTT
jgi:hypothetical protein